MRVVQTTARGEQKLHCACINRFREQIPPVCSGVIDWTPTATALALIPAVLLVDR
jgi:hypothetical protein